MVFEASSVDVERRAAVHAALGEPHRLAIVDALRYSDRSPSELATVTGLASNVLAYHLDTLEAAGLIERRPSHGDRRRRYVALRWEALAQLEPTVPVAVGTVLFVCTRNSARSQLAAGLWRRRTGAVAVSAGSDPAPQVHPLACAVGELRGLDLAGERPRGYTEVAVEPDLVVSVCDRAREAGIPWKVAQLHWSVADPVGGVREDFDRACAEIERRVDRLARALAA